MNKPILAATKGVTQGPLPGSKKTYVNGVPFREVALSGGEPPVRLGPRAAVRVDPLRHRLAPLCAVDDHDIR